MTFRRHDWALHQGQVRLIDELDGPDVTLVDSDGATTTVGADEVEPLDERKPTDPFLCELIAHAWRNASWEDQREGFFAWFENWIGDSDLCVWTIDADPDPWDALDQIALETWRTELDSDPAIGPFAGRG